MYDIDAMKDAVAKCDEAIATFEDAIRRELETKMEYQRIVRELEAKQNGTDS